jgi:hypothetical protein
VSVSWLWGEPAANALAINVIQGNGILTLAWGSNNHLPPCCPKRILLRCAHYCECELICREIETYSNNAMT